MPETKATILHFETNKPQVVKLRYPEGIPTKGQYGPQVMFSLLDPPDTRMYVPVFVANCIQELKIGPGRAMQILKAEIRTNGKRSTEWKVRPLEAEPGAAVPINFHATGHGELVVPRVTPIKGNGSTTEPSNGHATHHGIPYRDAKTDLAACYDQAIEVLVTAREHAASRDLPVQFTGEDLRQVAATLYIDQGRDRRTPWRPPTP